MDGNKQPETDPAKQRAEDEITAEPGPRTEDASPEVASPEDANPEIANPEDANPEVANPGVPGDSGENGTGADGPGTEPGSKGGAPAAPEPRVMAAGGAGDPGRDGSGVPEPTSSREAGSNPVADLESDYQALAEKTRNQLLRVAADFENYKKRARRDIEDAVYRARDEVLQELLPVMDNLELAVEHASSSGEAIDANSLLEGVQMVMRQFRSAMERFQIRPFDSLGQTFDPNFHEALQQRETEDAPPGTVVEEFRRGYMMGDRLIRPAMVVVAQAPGGVAAGSEPGANEDN